MKKIVLGTILLLSVGVAQAVESPQWDSVSLSYQSVDLDGDKLTGFGIAGTKLVGESVFIVGAYSSVSDDLEVLGTKVNVDFNTLSLGLGFRHAISSNTDLFGVVSYQDLELDASAQGVSESVGDNGYGLQVGIRSLVTGNVELGGSLSYLDIGDESETGVSISAMYYFTDQFSAGVGYGKSDDVNSFSLSGTLFF